MARVILLTLERVLMAMRNARNFQVSFGILNSQAFVEMKENLQQSSEVPSHNLKFYPTMLIASALTINNHRVALSKHQLKSIFFLSLNVNMEKSQIRISKN